MIDLLLQLIFMISLGVIVYIIASAIPKIEDKELEFKQGGIVKKVIKNLPLEKLDTIFVSLREKVLRRVRIILLKADNFITKRLNKR